jgi:hypothetical protein
MTLSVRAVATGISLLGPRRAAAIAYAKLDLYIHSNGDVAPLVHEDEGHTQEIEGALRGLLGLARASPKAHPVDDADLLRIGSPEI